MTGTDPAIEAVQRARECDNSRLWALKDEALTPVAREALAPIRELHKPYLCHCDAPHHACEGCLEEWPCDTARLIYSETELGSE
ncbi:hypothetical protein WKY82_09145 [Gordonia malaquae]|uniref:hypothetical protein n=1 Tax=Gordonia malaquae TaxID=410332 RepID=UPI0030C78B49